MIRLRIFFRFAMCVLLWRVSTCEATATNQTVRVGVYQNRPKVFCDESGTAQGIFIDLIRAVAREEHWTLEFVPGTWTEGLDRLTRGEIDLMPDVSFSPERETKWTFTHEPVLSDWFQAMTLQNQTLSSVFDLSGKRIAVLKNSVQIASVTKMAKDLRLDTEIIPMPDYDEGERMLLSGEVDVLIANRYLAATMENRSGIKASMVTFHPTRLHFAAPPGKRPGLIAAIDHYLTVWKADPKSIYYRTIDKWVSKSIKTVTPFYIKCAVAILSAILLLTAGIAILFRWQIRKQTGELQQKTRDLESALQCLRETQEKAIEQERLHVLGQMASGIAHDFNNILMPIIGLSDMMLGSSEKMRDPELVKTNLSAISGAAQDGAKIIERMKEFYRAHEAKELQWTDPGKVIETVAALSHPLRLRAEEDRTRRIGIKTRLTGKFRVRADETELREALMNLIGNAVDAMPGGGTVTIEAKQKNQQTVLSVKDTGTGMSPEVKERCLSAFYTTKGKAGTGIGLAMVKNLCDRCEAHLEIETEEGKGTTVSIVFPRQHNELSA